MILSEGLDTVPTTLETKERVELKLQPPSPQNSAIPNQHHHLLKCAHVFHVCVHECMCACRCECVRVCLCTVRVCVCVCVCECLECVRVCVYVCVDALCVQCVHACVCVCSMGAHVPAQGAWACTACMYMSTYAQECMHACM